MPSWEALAAGGLARVGAPRLNREFAVDSSPSGEKHGPHSGNLRVHRCKEESATFFVTKCLSPRQPVLVRSGMAAVVVQTLRFAVEERRILLAAFVVMPDHWHALMYVMPPLTLPVVMHRLNSWIGRETRSVLRNAGVGWQNGYYETRIRSTRQFAYVRGYIEGNPERQGLVGDRRDWRWSSAQDEYAGMLTRPWPWGFEQDKD